jgi:hypothetical protein
MLDYTTDSLQLEEYANKLQLPLIEVLSKDELLRLHGQAWRDS